MIRVAHLIKGLGRGGAETLLPHLAAANPARAQHVAVAYFLPWKHALADPLRSCGVEVTCLEASSNLAILASVPRVVRWLRRTRPDIVHCHLPVSGAVGRLASRLIGVPVVYTEHNLQERYRPATRALNRLTWRLQDGVVAVSEEVERSIADHLPRGVPVRTIRNGVPEPLDGTEPATLPWAERHPVVGTVAVFRTQKRLDVWLDVARRVSEARPDVRFVIVGDGPERPNVEASIRELGLSEVVFLAGLRDDVPAWLAAMDLYLMTSEFEGLPLALLEAMMAGLAVVATPVGGIPEVITDREDGLLRPLADREGLANSLIGLLDDSSARRALGERGRSTVRSGFGIQRMSDELEAVYSTVVDAESAA